MLLASTDGGTVIEFDTVSKTFRDGTHAVQDLSLTIPSDQITVIVGPSGCGKTTTLRMVNRMLEPSNGKIMWDGSPLKSRRKTTLRRQMGYVIQSGGLFPHRTVVENIGTVPGLLGWSKEKTRSRSMELLTNVGLDRGMANRYPAQLSGGQQQRVGVARALAADPLVMLMDEPFSAVDPVVRTELHEFFLGLQREISKTIVLITHDIDEAIKLGDQVAILRVGGRLAQAGPPQQLLDEPADAFVEGFVGRDRGYRSLSFLPAAGLALGEVAVVREATSGGDGGPTLVLDKDARPVGWLDPEHAGLVHPIGATFVREVDTLRAALDSALTSPFAIATAVEADTGRYVGTATADVILDSVRAARGTSSPPVTLQAAEAREQQTHEAQSAVSAAYAQLEGDAGPAPDAGPDADTAPGAAADTATPDEAQDEGGGATAVPLVGHADSPADAEEQRISDEQRVAEEPGTADDAPGSDSDPTPEDEQPTTIREAAVAAEETSGEGLAPGPVIYTQPRALPPESGGSHG